MSESSEQVCCGILESLAAEYDLPFERPLVIEPQTHNLKIGGWVVRLNKLTKAGNLSKKTGKVIMINYCLFCGERLIDEPTT